MQDISDLIGIPYKDFGRDKNGLDCYGLAMEIFRRNGKELKEVNKWASEDFYYSDAVDYKPFLNIRKVDYIDELVLLEFCTFKYRLHVGIALDKKTFIHTTKSQGVRISSLGSAKQYMTLCNCYEVL